MEASVGDMFLWGLLEFGGVVHFSDALSGNR